MTREFIRILKYVFAGNMIAAFVTAFRMQAGAQVTAESMFFTGAFFLVLVIAILFWQMKKL